MRNQSLWTSAQSTVAEVLHRTYQQPLPSSLLHEHVFERSFNVSLDPKDDSSTVSASTRYPTSEHDDVERVSTAKTLVERSSSLAEGTMSLGESTIDAVSSVPLVSILHSGPNTVGIDFCNFKVSFSL